MLNGPLMITGVQYFSNTRMLILNSKSISINSLASETKWKASTLFIATVGLRMKIKNLLRETGLDIMNRNKHGIFFCNFFYKLSSLQNLGLKDKYIQYIQGALQYSRRLLRSLVYVALCAAINVYVWSKRTWPWRR